MENSSFQSSHNLNQQATLPNASIVLAFGIISIVLCWCHGIVGLIFAIIALILSGRDTVLYNANPGKYTAHSYSNLKAGRSIAIIGLVLASVFLFFVIIAVFFLGLGFALLPWEFLNDF